MKKIHISEAESILIASPNASDRKYEVEHKKIGGFINYHKHFTSPKNLVRYVKKLETNRENYTIWEIE